MAMNNKHELGFEPTELLTNLTELAELTNLSNKMGRSVDAVFEAHKGGPLGRCCAWPCSQPARRAHI